MNTPAEPLTPEALRDWPLPRTPGSKYARGQLLVVGGARSTPGAVMLAALAAMRVGGGRLSIGVASSVAVPVAVAIPEAGVIGLEETSRGSVVGACNDELAAELSVADAVLVGPGLDDREESAGLVRAVIAQVVPQARLLLDAHALTALSDIGRGDLGTVDLAGRLVLTPNLGEAATLLGCELGDIEAAAAEDLSAQIAVGYQAVVTLQGCVADATGTVRRVATGHSGLATSGSGDVLAGAITGLLGRGADPDQAAAWGSYIHAAAGDRLAARVGPTGFLARELLDELPRVLVELTA